MSQPPKSTILAPKATWVSNRGVWADMEAPDNKWGRHMCRQRPSVLLPESCPATTGGSPSAPSPTGRVSPECCDAHTASCGWYGVPERFRANCAFGGHPMRAALSHPHRVTARAKHTLKSGCPTIEKCGGNQM